MPSDVREKLRVIEKGLEKIEEAKKEIMKKKSIGDRLDVIDGLKKWASKKFDRKLYLDFDGRMSKISFDLQSPVSKFCDQAIKKVREILDSHKKTLEDFKNLLFSTGSFNAASSEEKELNELPKHLKYIEDGINKIRESKGAGYKETAKELYDFINKTFPDVGGINQARLRGDLSFAVNTIEYNLEKGPEMQIVNKGFGKAKQLLLDEQQKLKKSRGRTEEDLDF